MKKNIEITKDMLIGDLVNNIEGVAGVLMSCGMYCIGCPASLSESLENACLVHGLDVDKVLARLNEAVAAA